MLALLLVAWLACGWLSLETSFARLPASPTDPPFENETSEIQSPRHSVTIRPGPPAPRVATGLRHPDGTSITVACSTCHATRKPNELTRGSRDLDEFHQSVSVAHGNLSCLSCHHADDYDHLKLADGTPVAFPDVMTLCAQCHGTQMRDYERGAHGGMQGYWDLKRGPRERNNCVDCHQAHRPQFPTMTPTFKPEDRFLTPHSSREHDHD